MPQIYQKNNRPMNQNLPPAPASSGQDTIAAFIIVIMMLLSGTVLYKIFNSIFTHEALIGADRRGNQIVSAPYSLTWWIGLVVCFAAFCYCGYLLVQLLKKK